MKNSDLFPIQAGHPWYRRTTCSGN